MKSRTIAVFALLIAATGCTPMTPQQACAVNAMALAFSQAAGPSYQPVPLGVPLAQASYGVSNCDQN